MIKNLLVYLAIIIGAANTYSLWNVIKFMERQNTVNEMVRDVLGSMLNTQELAGKLINGGK